MQIQYFGHSCFFIKSDKGLRFIIDPYSSSIPHNFPETTADIVIISHEHKDHNDYRRILGDPKIVKRTSNFPTEYEFNFPQIQESIIIKGLPCFHDKPSRSKRAPNTIFSWVLDGLNLCFLGDLGHLLSPEQIKSLTPVDILFIPVGGKTTINTSEAVLTITELQPKVVFPMHYKTPQTESLDLAEQTLDDFIKQISFDLEKTNSSKTEINKINLPINTKVVILEPK